MPIDNTNAIRAFAQERIRHLKAITNHPEKDNGITELEMILTLCDGLTKQNELLTKAETL